MNIINSKIYTTEEKQSLYGQFNTARPYRHVIIDQFLDAEFANSLCTHFPSLEAMKTHYHGLNENKSEDSEFDKLHTDFSALRAALSSAAFIEWLEAWTGVSGFSTIHDRLGYGLHQGGNNSFLDIHIDYNIHPIKKLHRRLNLILFFNKGWEPHFGGNLELWDKDVKNCEQSITPVFNRCVIFECSEISFHGYSKISVPDHITRKSYYQYYFTPVPADISYHDTIFKPRPKEALGKKILTPVKEFAKNTAKKIVLKMGMEKYLK